MFTWLAKIFCGSIDPDLYSEGKTPKKPSGPASIIKEWKDDSGDNWAYYHRLVTFDKATFIKVEPSERYASSINATFYIPAGEPVHQIKLVRPFKHGRNDWFLAAGQETPLKSNCEYLSEYVDILKTFVHDYDGYCKIKCRSWMLKDKIHNGRLQDLDRKIRGIKKFLIDKARWPDEYAVKKRALERALEKAEDTQRKVGEHEFLIIHKPPTEVYTKDRAVFILDKHKECYVKNIGNGTIEYVSLAEAQLMLDNWK